MRTPPIWYPGRAAAERTPAGEPPAAALERELLELVHRRGPATLLRLFDRDFTWTHSAPTWATEAAARLLTAGLIACKRQDAELSLTDAGRAQLVRPRGVTP